MWTKQHILQSAAYFQCLTIKWGYVKDFMQFVVPSTMRMLSSFAVTKCNFQWICEMVSKVHVWFMLFWNPAILRLKTKRLWTEKTHDCISVLLIFPSTLLWSITYLFMLFCSESKSGSLSFKLFRHVWNSYGASNTLCVCPFPLGSERFMLFELELHWFRRMVYLLMKCGRILKRCVTINYGYSVKILALMKGHSMKINRISQWLIHALWSWVWK